MAWVTERKQQITQGKAAGGHYGFGPVNVKRAFYFDVRKPSVWPCARRVANMSENPG